MKKKEKKMLTIVLLIAVFVFVKINFLSVNATENGYWEESTEETDDEEEADDADYTVVVKGNIASDEVITVTPDATVTMEDVKNVKASITGDVTQTVTKFVNAEAKDKVYPTATDTIGVSDATGTAAGNITVKGLNAGSWNGSFNFTIGLLKTRA